MNADRWRCRVCLCARPRVCVCRVQFEAGPGCSPGVESPNVSRMSPGDAAVDSLSTSFSSSGNGRWRTPVNIGPGVLGIKPQHDIWPSVVDIDLSSPRRVLYTNVAVQLSWRTYNIYWRVYWCSRPTSSYMYCAAVSDMQAFKTLRVSVMWARRGFSLKPHGAPTERSADGGKL